MCFIIAPQIRWQYLILFVVIIDYIVNNLCIIANNKANWSTSGSPLRLRAYPSAAGQTIALMPNGASVTVYGAWQGWNTVEYNGNLGYAAEAYIEN